MSIAQTNEKIKTFFSWKQKHFATNEKKSFFFEVKHLFDDKIPAENYTRPLVGATTLSKTTPSINKTE